MIMSGPKPAPYSAIGIAPFFGGPAGAVIGVRRRPSWVRRGQPGLGQQSCMSGGEIAAAMPAMQNCDPRDSACVLCNGQISNAVSDMVDSGCIAPGTPIQFQCDTSPNAVQSFMNNQPTPTYAVVGTGATAYTATGTPPPATPPVVPPPPPTIVQPSPPTQPTAGSTAAQNAGSANSQANGGATGGGTVASTVQGYVSALTDSTADLIPGVPNWMLLAGGVVILAALIEKKW